MTNSQRLASVRDYLEAWHNEKSPGVSWNPTESILVSDGCYCGRRFIFEPFSAIWFVEEDQVKIFDADGTVTECKQCSEIYMPEVSQQRRAA